MNRNRRSIVHSALTWTNETSSWSETICKTGWIVFIAKCFPTAESERLVLALTAIQSPFPPRWIRPSEISRRWRLPLCARACPPWALPPASSSRYTPDLPASCGRNMFQFSSTNCKSIQISVMFIKRHLYIWKTPQTFTETTRVRSVSFHHHSCSVC